MIQAALKGRDGRAVYLFGLSRANMQLLLAGRPIHVDGTALGLNAHVMIVGGESENDIYTSLANHAGESITYTCCEKHAVEAGLMHRPGNGTQCPPDASGLADV